MKKLQSHFSQIDTHIKEILQNAKYSIKVAMYSFTDRNLFQILCLKAVKGLSVELIVDYDQCFGYNELFSDSYFEDTNLSILESNLSFFLLKNNNGKYSHMHNKFCIVDGEIVVTGSYNWTNNAKSYNDENITIINDQTLACDYISQFNILRKSSEKYNLDNELDISFDISNDVVLENTNILLSWFVKGTNEILINDKKYSNIGEEKIYIKKNEKFTLTASNGTITKSKTVAVSVLKPPKIQKFEIINNKRIIRPGEDIILSWVVEEATKIEITGIGEVNATGQKNLKPTQTTSYILSAYNDFGKEENKSVHISVAEFQLPRFESLVIPVPNIKIDIDLKLQNLALNDIKNLVVLEQVLAEKKVLNNVIEIENIIHITPEHILNNQKAFNAQLQEKIKKYFNKLRYESIKAGIFEIKKSVLNKTESILETMLNYIKKQK